MDGNASKDLRKKDDAGRGEDSSTDTHMETTGTPARDHPNGHDNPRTDTSDAEMSKGGGRMDTSLCTNVGTYGESN